jgi:hypothetical protein
MSRFERRLPTPLPKRRQLHRLWKAAISPLLSVDPRLIVLGNQKSGTSAIAALLAAHTGLSATLDLRGLFKDMELRLHAGDITFEEFVRRNKYDFARDIIKEPSLTLLYPKLRPLFPRAQFLMIVRDPRDNIRSILNRLNIDGNLRDVDPRVVSSLRPADWQLVIDGQWLGLHGTYIEMLAERWNRCVDVYQEHSGEMALIRYEDFRGDKAGAIEGLASRFGLPQVRSISSAVDVQYNRRGKDRHMPWEQFFGPGNLRRIEEICAERMQELAYLGENVEFCKPAAF